MSVQQWDAEGSGGGAVDDTGDAVVCDLDASSSRHLRLLVRDLLDGRDDGAVDDAVLVADELATNALRHGASPRVCRLALVDDGRSLRIEVDDAGVEQPCPRAPDSSGGRGLMLVDRLTTGWGVAAHAGHKTVWAVLPAGAEQRASSLASRTARGPR